MEDTNKDNGACQHETLVMRTDTERLDFLEEMANLPSGILLHDGSQGGRLGLGLRPGNLRRTLREAIDSSMDSQNK